MSSIDWYSPAEILSEAALGNLQIAPPQFLDLIRLSRLARDPPRSPRVVLYWVCDRESVSVYFTIVHSVMSDDYWI